VGTERGQTLEQGGIMADWKKTKYPGLRYREHPTRKHGVKKDRYYCIRYTLSGQRCEEALGWASEGMTEEKAAIELGRLKEAQRKGIGAQTLAERRKKKRARIAAEKKREEKEKKELITFGDFYRDIYLPVAKTEKTLQTMRTEQSYFKLWIDPVIGKKPIKEIAYLDLERIKKRLMDKGKSPKTIRDNLAIVRLVINYAKSIDRFYGDNPVHAYLSDRKRKNKIKVDNRRARYLSHDEAQELLTALFKKSPDLHDMALLALHCGPRAGEIFGLDWRDIDFDKKIITFRHTKNGIVRHVPMTDRVKTMLADRKKDSDSILVFPDRKGKKRAEISNSFEKIIIDLGWNEGITDRRQRVVFHSLRHTCASWLVMAGVPLFTVKEYLGHQQISQTERYAHLSPDSFQQATAILNQIGKAEKPKAKVRHLKNK
jgi:integrase